MTFDSLHCAELIYECYAILCDVKNVENLADRQQIKIMTMATNVDKYWSAGYVSHTVLYQFDMPIEQNIIEKHFCFTCEEKKNGFLLYTLSK